MTHRADDPVSDPLGGLTVPEPDRTERDPSRRDPDGPLPPAPGPSPDDTIAAEESFVPEDGELEPGQIVGPFEVMRLLRRGGMGEIYVARDTSLGRRVALKLVHPRLIGSTEAKEQFLEEARTTAQFSHPHIVTIHGVGEHLGRPYVALEYLEGENLRERVFERRPKLAASLRIALAVAEALAEAHRNGVLHLDLKPENVMIPRDGRVRVVDFGLAMTSLGAEGGKGGDRVDEDGAPMVWGTPRFMAPEQWTKAPLDGAADVWALGMILYELSTGQLPHGRLASRAELYGAICSPEPVPSVAEHADLPDELVSLIHRCLDKDAKARPAASDVAEALREMLFGNWTRPTDDEGPFRGLLPFTERHADLYFGRETEIAAFVERSRLVPVLPVVGPSGAGKSSFVRAGVFQRLREEEPWIFLKLQPGTRPFDALAARLHDVSQHAQTIPPPPTSLSAPPSFDGLTPVDHSDALGLAAELRETPRRLSVALRQLADEQGRKVLLFVDQLEELFTLVEEDAVRRAFVRALCTAADDAQDPVRVVFCIRDDFLGRLATDPEVAQALAQITVIQSLGRDALREVMVRPVEAVGYGYEDPDLPREMVDAVGGEPGCLPLLQFAGRRLWEERDKVRRLLLRNVYDEMGGVEGALATHADGVLDTLTSDQLAMARTLLLRLVTPNRARRRRNKIEALEGVGDEAEQVLARLTDARLVVVTTRGGAEDAAATLELAHESLIWSWGTLARWLDETREERGFLAEVGQAAELWDKRGRRPEELWRGTALGDALRARARCSTALPGRVADFLREAELRDQSRARRKRRMIGLAVGSSAAVAVVAVAVALHVADKEREAIAERDRAEQQRAATLRESASAALSQGHLLEARAKLRLAMELEDDPAARALWWQLSIHPLVWRHELSDRVFAVDFSPDGKLIAAGCHDEAIYLFDTVTRRTRVLHGNGDQVLGLTFLPDGDRLLTSSYNGEVRLWDVEDGTVRQVFRGNQGRTYDVAVSSDGRLAAAGDDAGIVRVWRIGDGERIHELAGHDSKIDGVAFHPGGQWLVSAGADGEVREWNVSTGKARRSWGDHAGGATAVAFASSGRWLATAAASGEIFLRDGDRGAVVRRMHVHTEPVDALRFSPDGSRLISGGYDGQAIVWDVASGVAVRRHRHGKHVSSVAVSPDGELFATASWDHAVRLWHADLVGRPEPAPEPSGSRSISFHPSGERFVSAHYDGSIRFWDVSSGAPLGTVEGHRAALYDVAYSPDGRVVASSSDDSTVRIWDEATRAEQRVLAGHRRGVTGLSFHPDGRTLASASKDGTVRLWDVDAGREKKTLRGSGSELFDVAFSPDGETVVAAGGPTVKIWNATTGEVDRELDGPRSNLFGVGISPDGQTVVAGASSGAVWRWDLRTLSATVIGRHPERVYWLNVHPAGGVVGAPGSDGNALLWNVADETHRALLGHRDEVNNVEFSPDGRFAATAADDGTVRLWEVATGRPHWRAPVLVGSPPRLLSHEGWTALDGSDTPAPTGRWMARIETQARRARVAGSLACMLLEDGTVEAWDVVADERLARDDTARFSDVTMAMGSCVARAPTGVVVLGRDGSVRTWLEGVATDAVAGDGDGILVAYGDGVARLDAEGREIRRHAAGASVSALLGVEEGLVLGFGEGNLELRSGDGGSTVSFQGVPSAAPETMVAGPSGTLLVGYANGQVGLWSIADGKKLAQARLHGRVVHLHLEAQRLYAATDLGDHLLWDLGAFHRPYCELLEDVWAQVPVIWVDGEPQPRPVPAHRCRDAPQGPR